MVDGPKGVGSGAGAYPVPPATPESSESGEGGNAGALLGGQGAPAPGAGKTLKLFLPWQNLIAGLKGKKTDVTVGLPGGAASSDAAAGAADKARLDLAKQVTSEKKSAGEAASSDPRVALDRGEGSTRPGQMSRLNLWIPNGVAWLRGSLELIKQDLSLGAISEAFKKYGPLGFFALVWYDPSKGRPGSVSLSLGIHLLLLIFLMVIGFRLL